MKNPEIPRIALPHKKIFEAAGSDRIVAEDVVLYSQSLERVRAYQAGLEYAAEQSMEKGLEKGIKIGLQKGLEKGREEGREMEKKKAAEILIMMNQTDDFISHRVVSRKNS